MMMMVMMMVMMMMMMMIVIIITFDDEDDGSRLAAAGEAAPGMNYDASATARHPAVGIFKKTDHCDDYLFNVRVQLCISQGFSIHLDFICYDTKKYS